MARMNLIGGGTGPRSRGPRTGSAAVSGCIRCSVFSCKNRRCRSRSEISQLGAQRARVDRRADLRVVVEIDIDVAGAAARRLRLGGDQPRVVGFEAAGPQLDPRRPVVERLVRIAARIELLGAVQAQIDEIGGDVLGIGPSHRVGEDERHAVPAQQRDKGGVEKARMADLDRVPQIAPALGPRPGAAGQPVIVPRASAAAISVSRGSMERKWSRRSASNLKRGENCHRKGPSFSSSRNTPEAKKLASGVSMSCSCFRCVMNRLPLTAKTKPSGVSSRQRAKESGPLQRIMRAVDLDRVDLPAGIGRARRPGASRRG